MRAKINTFFSSGPLGAVVGVISGLIFVFLKGPVVSSAAGLLKFDPANLDWAVIPLGAFPIFFGGAMLLGYLGGLFGGLFRRKKLGIILGGILGGLLSAVIFTLK